MAARSLRGRVCEELRARGVDPEEWREAVDAYVRAEADVQRLRADWQRSGFPMTTLGGATGMTEIPHPLIGLIDQAEKRSATLRQRLMLDPLSARGGGVGGHPVGLAQAPDRVARPSLKAVK